MNSSPATNSVPARLRPLQPGDREMIFRWRNSNEIRRFMFNTAPIPWEDHCRWFQRTCGSDNTRFFIFEWNKTPIGTVSFSRLETEDSTAKWGFYIAPEHSNSGFGSIMGFMALNLAFRELPCSKIIGEVLDFNERSAEYHQKLGFQQYGSRQAEVNGIVHNVLIFHLTESQWQSVRDSVRLRVTKGKPQLAWL